MYIIEYPKLNYRKIVKDDKALKAALVEPTDPKYIVWKSLKKIKES
jgi:hypothetical protein